MGNTLPEVTFLRDARGERPADAVGAGKFWYEPEVWTLSGLSPAAKVLYAGLCSFLGQQEVNRKDLRNTLKESSDPEILEAFGELSRHGLLGETARGFEIYPAGSFELSGGNAAS